MPGKTDLRDQALAVMRELPQLSDREIARQLGISNKTVSRWRNDERLSREPVVDSLSTRELLERVRELGHPVSDRRLRRWVDEGVIGARAFTRRYDGAGSRTIWYPGVVDQVLEAERLMRLYKNTRDVILGLLAYGHAIDEEVAQRAYHEFLLEIRDGELLVPPLTDEGRDSPALRRRSLQWWRWALDDIVGQHGDLAAMSALARQDRELELSEDTRIGDVLYGQVEATRRIFRGELEEWWQRGEFVHALEDAPPVEQLEELHRRLSFESVSRAVAEASAEELSAAAYGICLVLSNAADLVLERSEREPDWRYFPPGWHQAYREVLNLNPLIAARLVPFFLAVQPSETLQPLIGSWLVEAAMPMLFPDWRVMLAVLFTWPQLASAGWRAPEPAGGEHP